MYMLSAKQTDGVEELAMGFGQWASIHNLTNHQIILTRARNDIQNFGAQHMQYKDWLLNFTGN
jgi:hypothetical protein